MRFRSRAAKACVTNLRAWTAWAEALTADIGSRFQHLSDSRVLGGNPDVTPFLQDHPMPPLPQEAGWKDTLKMYP
jgi:hypothetical protein